MLQNLRKKIALAVSCLLFAGVCLPVHADEESFVLIRDENNQVQLITEPDLVSRYSQNYPHFTCTYSRSEHGEILFSSHYRFEHMCYAVTDGSELPEEFIHPWWWDEDSLFQITVEEIDPAEATRSDLYYEDGQPELLSYTEGYEDWFSRYPEGARLFTVTYSFEYREDWEQMSKQLALYDNVLDVFYRWEDLHGTAMWDGSTMFVYTREYSDNPQLIGEISEQDMQELKLHCAEYKLWLTKWENWKANSNADSMTPAEAEASRIAAGIESPYDMTMEHIRFISELSQKYPGAIDDTFLSFTRTADAPATIHVQNVWETVGDSDGDEILSSADAAVILMIAADKGAQNRNYLTEEITNADLNSDGKADASDAALLLQYVARCGAGEELSLKDFIRTAQNS